MPLKTEQFTLHVLMILIVLLGLVLNAPIVAVPAAMGYIAMVLVEWAGPTPSFGWTLNTANPRAVTMQRSKPDDGITEQHLVHHIRKTHNDGGICHWPISTKVGGICGASTTGSSRYCPAHLQSQGKPLTEKDREKMMSNPILNRSEKNDPKTLPKKGGDTSLKGLIGKALKAKRKKDTDPKGGAA